jgi:dTMP kinase
MPLLKKNYIVIADRYIYTAMTRDAANGAGKMIGRIIYNLVRKPDLLIFHNVAPNICLDRIKRRGKILFHTNQKIQRSNALKDKDLYYLKKLNNEYMRLLSFIRESKETNIIVVNDGRANVLSCIKRYLDKKTKKKTVNDMGEMTNGKETARHYYSEKS